ncbi:hypothetical protein Tco_0540274 [Tanacetum coccineum]
MVEDSAKKKGKGKASQSFSSAEFVEELRAMRITRESEIEFMNKRLEVDKKREKREIKREERELKREERELKKEERKTKKMYLLHLNALLAKDHLSPEDKDMKRNLYEMLYGKTVRGETLEGISLSILGNEKRTETDEALNVFLDFNAKNAKGIGVRAQLDFNYNVLFV